MCADEVPRFVEDVQVLLEAKRVSCHGPEKQEGGLRLDSFVAAQEGGDRGAAIVAGDLEQSLLVRAITFLDPDLQMPPKQKLTDNEIDTLTQWVKTGAAWPEPVAVLFEDEPQLRAQVQRQLQADGYAVDVSGDGKDGLYLASEYPLDAAIVDLGLPRLSGIEIIKQLRLLGKHPTATR